MEARCTRCKAESSKRRYTVGFTNAISDGFYAAFIPLLEVLPEYQNRGIGSELVRRMLEMLQDFYSIDIACEEDAQRFLSKAWFTARGWDAAAALSSAGDRT